MGLLGDLEQRFSGNQSNALTQAVGGLISNSGGLSGLINRFTQSGLGQQVQSWVGNGQNQPITGDHVTQVFGSEQIQKVAQQLGTDHPQAANLIARILPHLVDQATRQGQVVSDPQAQQSISGLLSKGLASLLGPKQ
jgi:uncharacterized protein YidB (DUF937 family)